jgi:hypothetical protein
MRWAIYQTQKKMGRAGYIFSSPVENLLDYSTTQPSNFTIYVFFPGRCVSGDSLKAEIESFGLSRKAKGTLASVVCGGKTSITSPAP